MTVATLSSGPAAGASAGAGGRRKAAVALVALGPERASALLRGLDEEEVTQLAREIAELGEVSADEVRATVAELDRGLRSITRLPAPGKRFARQLLVQALGADRGAAACLELDRPAPFAWLAAADPDTAASALAAEPPAALALALAHVEPRVAAALLVRLPDERRGLVASRLAALGTVHPDTLREVEAGLRARVDDVLSSPTLALEGPKVLAEVLSKAGRDTARELLGALALANPDLAEAVRAALFTFDDVCGLDARQMQVLLRDVDMRQLALAVATASADVQGRFLMNLSERARETLSEEIDLAGTARPKDVAEARTGIVAAARRLEEEGILVLSREDDDA